MFRTLILEELSETGYSIRLRSLWLTYQDYLKYNHTDNESHKPIVTHKPVRGLSGDILKSGGRLRTDGYKRSVDQKVDGDKNTQRELTDKGHQVQDIIQPVLTYKVKGQGLKDRNIANDEASNQNAAAAKEQNGGIKEQEVGVNNGLRRRLLNFDEENMNINEADMNNEEITNNTSFILDVDIQPDSVKLLPWESGSLAELQKVCYLLNHILACLFQRKIEVL
jgi:hypothetical protein